MKIAVISDTHSKYRKELDDILLSCDLIIHAGDIGNGILEQLNQKLPTIAIRGNIDTNNDASHLGLYVSLPIESFKILVLHNINDLQTNKELEECKTNYNMIIYGHSHIPKVYEEDGIIYLNPGSIGPKRFKNPITYVIMVINGNDIKYKQYEL